MEFGRPHEAELNSIDFRLPPDAPFNKGVLEGKPVNPPHVCVGCAKWGRVEWQGKIYPLKTKERNYLDHYVRHFNAIELNATHYKMYGERAIRKWAVKAAGKDFLFCPKMFKGVTHKGNLGMKNFLLNEFLRGIAAFGEHLGPIFVQLDDRFSPRRQEELLRFLGSLPRHLSFFLEVRHPGWFRKDISASFFTRLQEIHIGAVITDTAGRRDCAHMCLTVPKAFIRFVGNSLHPTDYSRIDEWASRIKAWLDQGIKEVYFFVHMHDEAKSPELAAYVVGKLNESCGLDLQPPRFINGDGEALTKSP